MKKREKDIYINIFKKYTTLANGGLVVEWDNGIGNHQLAIANHMFPQGQQLN